MSTTSIAIARPRLLDRDARRRLRGAQRQLDAQDPVLVAGLGALGDDVGAELDHPAERAGLDLDLLVDAPLGLLDARSPLTISSRPETSRLTESGVDARELDEDDRARLLAAAVVDVDPRREARLLARGPRPALAGPGLADQLVHLAPHALEVQEQVALSAHANDLSEATQIPGRPSGPALAPGLGAVSPP